MKIPSAFILLFALLTQSQLSAQGTITYISENEKDLISNWDSSKFQDLTSYQQFSSTIKKTANLNEFYQAHKSELEKEVRF